MSIEGVAAAEPCDHFWMWTSPAGTSEAARVCMGCSAPSADWLNEIAALRAKVAAVEALADELDRKADEHFRAAMATTSEGERLLQVACWGARKNSADDLRAALATEEPGT